MEPPRPRSAPATGKPGSGPVIEVELAQSLGLAEALTIGVGTMIGAGIFVLPGFIIAGAGPAIGVSPTLLGDLTHLARAHVLVLKEQGQLPPSRILVLATPDRHTELTISVASRLAMTWEVPLTVAARVDADADDAAVSAA